MAGIQIDGVNNKIDFDDDLDTSISANTDDTLVIEAGGNTMATITATTFTINDGTTITTADNTDTLSLISTDTDSVIGPNLNLYRNAGNGADADVIASIAFAGNDDAGNATDYFRIFAQIEDASNGTEDVYVYFRSILAGEEVQRINLDNIGMVINEDSKDLDFRVESNGQANMLFVDGGNDRVHINGSTGTRELNVSGDNTRLLLYSTNNSTGAGQLQFGDADNEQIGRILYEHDSNAMSFHTDNTERMRITSAGRLLVGKTSSADATVGCELRENGQGTFTRSGGPGINVTRNTDDGELIKFIQDASLEGTISVSGTTVSYNGFTGSHWSRLADNSKPTILRGTIMDSIDEMCDWYQAVADVAEVKYTAEDSEVIDGDKNVGDVKTGAYKIIEEIALPSDKSVGDAVTFTSNGVEYTGKYVKEGDVKHVKSKVSDTADSTKIYGVFSHWDEEGADTVNDMFVSQVGTYVIRVHQGVTVAAGDLLVSNGDGTAKKQDDDIIRSKTVAKVNSNVKIETYSDGSYTVPCTLHC